ncbi:hypothetical protein ACFQ3Z_09715 [Streptomyces nogalater]
MLATPAMSLVDPDDYPADSLREDTGVHGSGPYELRSYEEGSGPSWSATTPTGASPSGGTTR